MTTNRKRLARTLAKYQRLVRSCFAMANDFYHRGDLASAKAAAASADAHNESVRFLKRLLKEI